MTEYTNQSIINFENHIREGKFDEDTIVNDAENIVKNKCCPSDNQLRQLYDIIHKIKYIEDEEKRRNELILAKPKIAYRGRNAKGGAKKLIGALLSFVDVCKQDPSVYDKLHLFMESLIAYSKYYNKKEGAR